MATGFFFCLLGIVFPLVFPYESEKDSFLPPDTLLMKLSMRSEGPVKIYAQNYLQARLSEVSRQ